MFFSPLLDVLSIVYTLLIFAFLGSYLLEHNSTVPGQFEVLCDINSYSNQKINELNLYRVIELFAILSSSSMTAITLSTVSTRIITS